MSVKIESVGVASALFASLLVGSTFLGCKRSARELTRREAFHLIRDSGKFSPETPTLIASPQEVECGIRQGFWQKKTEHIFRVKTVTVLSLTPRGKAFFHRISPRYSYPGAGELVLATKYRRDVVEVLGIADVEPPLTGWKGKEAQFTWKWRWDEFPEVLRNCGTAPAAQEGQAYFRLYDDGWRVEYILPDMLP